MFFILIILCVFGNQVSSDPKIYYDLEEAETYFEAFIVTYAKFYSSEEEYERRFKIFKQTLRELNKRNSQNEYTQVYKVNRFSDLTLEEFRRFHTGIRLETPRMPCESIQINTTSASRPVPPSFDWRDQDKVTRVKDQGLCGSCYTFSTVGSLESQYAILNDELVEFSEQQLADCDYSNGKCNGGWMSNSVLYLRDTGGIMTAEDYPYEDNIGECVFEEEKVQAKVMGCLNFTGGSEDDLLQGLVDYGPIAFTVWAESLRMYGGGIIVDCEQSEDGEIDHAVLLVGYGTENGTDYWIVKNSWGEKWGEDGYARIKRNVNSCSMMSPKGQIISVVLDKS